MIYKHKTKQRSPKYFRKDQKLIDLFKNLDGNGNPRKVLKNQNNFKSDLGEIRKGNPNSKSEDQISVLKWVDNVFEKKDYWFF